MGAVKESLNSGYGEFGRIQFVMRCWGKSVKVTPTVVVKNGMYGALKQGK